MEPATSGNVTCSLRKVFSKGHGSGGEGAEGEHAQQWDEPVIVRPKSKCSASGAATINEAPPNGASTEAVQVQPRTSAAHPPAAQAAVSIHGKAAWDFTDLGANAAAPRSPPKATLLAASTSTPVQHSLAVSIPSQPPAPSKAWGASPTSEKAVAGSPEKVVAGSPEKVLVGSPEKVVPKQHAKLSGIFRTGSKNARANEQTAIQSMISATSHVTVGGNAGQCNLERPAAPGKNAQTALVFSKVSPV